MSLREEHIKLLYAEHIFIDLNKLKDKEYEKALVEYNDYLPVYIIRFINPTYFTNIDENKRTKIYKKIGKHKFDTEKEKVEEFVEWVGYHKEFSDLVLWDNIDLVNNNIKYLEELETENKYINKGEKWLKRNK